MRIETPQDDGKVLDQSPPGGENLIRGSRIALTVGEAPRQARGEPDAPPDPAKTDAETPASVADLPDAEAPPTPLSPGAESEDEATPPAAPEPYEEPTQEPTQEPAESAPPADNGQAPGYYDQPAQEQYPEPSYDRQSEQPYSGGDDGYYSEDLGDDNPGYGGGTQDPDRGSYGDPESGDGRSPDRGGDSGYGGSVY